MNLVPTKHTGGSNWIAERFAALQERAITGPVARAIVAHWALETGWGVNEWNYNVGNLIAVGAQQAISLMADPAPGSNLRAFDSLGHGVDSYLSLLQGNYAECWARLENNPSSSDWVDCLGLHRYYSAHRHNWVDEHGKLQKGYVESYEGTLATVTPQAPAITSGEPEFVEEDPPATVAHPPCDAPEDEDV